MQRPSIESIRLEIKEKKDRLRDDFAAKIVSAYVSRGLNKDDNWICKRSYEIAEQMLKERGNYS